MPRYAWRQCRELAIAIVLCGVRDGCRASVGKLIEVANQNAPDAEPVIGSRRTFHRAMERLFALGLVCSDRQSNKNGNPAALRWILPDRLAQLVEESRKLAQQNREFPEENDFRGTHLAHTWHLPGTHRPYISTSSTSETSSTQPRSTVDDDQKCAWTGEEIQRVHRIARQVAKLIGKTKCRRDRDLLCKAAYLAGKVFSEDWLFDSVDGVVRTRHPNPYGCLHVCLAERAKKVGRVLNYELKLVTVPNELLDGKQNPADQLTERLCR